MRFKYSLLVLVILVFCLGSVYADDVSTIDIDSTSISSDQVEAHIVSNPGLKVRAVQLENIINLRIKELEIIINKLYEQQLLEEPEIVYLKEKLSELIFLREYVSEFIASEELSSEKDRIYEINEIRQKYIEVIRDVKEYLKNILVSEDIEIIKQEINVERPIIKQEIVAQNKERIRSFVQEHNRYVKENIVGPIVSNTKNQLKEKVKNMVGTSQQIKTRIISEAKQEIMENARERVGMIVGDSDKDEISRRIDEKRSQAKHEILERLEHQGSIISSADINVKDINAMRRIRQHININAVIE